MLNKFLIKRPMITEKAHDLSRLGKYVFLIDRRATAPEVRKIIETVYKVRVTAVNVLNMKPKPRRLGRSIGVKPGYKKAVVTLASGQKLDVLPH